jgi:hypothetical protein
LVQKIKSHQKLYAILILMDESKLILDVLDVGPEPMGDASLPRPQGQAQMDIYDLGSEHPYELKALQRIEAFSKCADALYREQWKIPPRLKAETHYDFPAEHFVFPFVSKPKVIGHGSYGQVYEVEIARGHLEFSQGHNEVNRS